ncbi:transcriptional regulator, TetR family [Micromonospora pattaloongensis]|uniref:Transcriptional regulator, TetR family n=1 Tax=Micromonospora pattaloongensis TaxID=405436 RepID=A0A1H3FHZ5_9ACTN|nr:TetR family transcriptional regulator [Micromonospora pattaloongensis]SDX90641.1 transcriptional regulator, TetR family [Micromonospora pattaloongensis]
MSEPTARPGAAAEPAGAHDEQTRRLILDTAVRLFGDRGYTETTMRAVAQEAGVAVGDAYYHFGSKEELIQGFYLGTQLEHRTVARPVLARESDLGPRLGGVLHAGLDVLAPHRAFAGTLLGAAAVPTSPLSPFSAESAEPRHVGIGLFREVLEGSSTRIDPEVRSELPDLLWLAYLALIFYWLHDRSPDQARTRALIDIAVPLIERGIGLSRVRVLRPITRHVLDVIQTVRP